MRRSRAVGKAAKRRASALRSLDRVARKRVQHSAMRHAMDELSKSKQPCWRPPVSDSRQPRAAPLVQLATPAPHRDVQTGLRTFIRAQRTAQQLAASRALPPATSDSPARPAPLTPLTPVPLTPPHSHNTNCSTQRRAHHSAHHRCLSSRAERHCTAARRTTLSPHRLPCRRAQRCHLFESLSSSRLFIPIYPSRFHAHAQCTTPLDASSLCSLVVQLRSPRERHCVAESRSIAPACFVSSHSSHW